MELCCGVSTARHSPALPQRHHRLHPQLNATATSLPSVFLRGQRLQSQRLSQHSLSSSSRGLVQCVSCTYGDSSSQEFGKSGDGRIKNNVQFDLNLPRRSALLEFTCNVCKARTERMINPDAFRRGTVYVQCGGCKAYHQLVDNLNLVKEYDFKNEVDPMRNELDI